MRYAIVDNATLTAVQRLLGDIPIYNKHAIDGEIDRTDASTGAFSVEISVLYR